MTLLSLQWPIFEQESKTSQGPSNNDDTLSIKRFFAYFFSKLLANVRSLGNPYKSPIRSVNNSNQAFCRMYMYVLQNPFFTPLIKTRKSLLEILPHTNREARTIVQQDTTETTQFDTSTFLILDNQKRYRGEKITKFSIPLTVVYVKIQDRISEVCY